MAFGKMDEKDDATFYSFPRIGIHHIDDPCIQRLTNWYGQLVASKDIRVHVDLASSWVSHFPTKSGIIFLGEVENSVFGRDLAQNRRWEMWQRGGRMAADDRQEAGAKR